MNYLGIDYGTKMIGLAVAVNGIISPLETVKNDSQVIEKIKELTKQYKIDRVVIGLPQGWIVKRILEFKSTLETMLQLPVETVDETVSSIEADQVLTKVRPGHVRGRNDAVAAAIILSRLVN